MTVKGTSFLVSQSHEMFHESPSVLCLLVGSVKLRSLAVFSLQHDDKCARSSSFD